MATKRFFVYGYDDPEIPDQTAGTLEGTISRAKEYLEDCYDPGAAVEVYELIKVATVKVPEATTTVTYEVGFKKPTTAKKKAKK